ncbi:MAG: lipopolysaccharide export system ATP-binding protein [Candidatus Deianiraeaceae bacterium]|jgi:lipopolysaccharide export system ATP-binding protein
MSQIIVNNLQKFFGKKHVIKGLNLTINTGEVVGILGPNGAGKTTAFYMIIGIAKPSGGNIIVDGCDITYMSMHERGRLGIGYLPQEPSIFRGLSVEDNIIAILEIVEKDRKKIRIKLDELLEEFNILHLRKERSPSLSGGERRRLEIARLLALNPKFVFLDEPFAGVDPISVIDINNLIKHLKDKNIGVVITDHNVRETLKITDRTYIIYNGTVLTEGTQEDILSHEGVQKHYLGNSFDVPQK